MNHYTVISGELSETDYTITNDGFGPSEYYRDHVVIEANNKEDAKSIALKTKKMQNWVQYARNWMETIPFNGLEVLDNIWDYVNVNYVVIKICYRLV